MEELISSISSQHNHESTILAIQELSNRITKLGLKIDETGIRTKPLTKDEMYAKELDRRSLLKSRDFQLACQVSLNPENNIEIILSMT